MILDHEDNNDQLGNLLATSPLQRLNLEMEQVPCLLEIPSSLLHLTLLDKKSEGE